MTDFTCLVCKEPVDEDNFDRVWGMCVVDDMVYHMYCYHSPRNIRGDAVRIERLAVHDAYRRDTFDGALMASFGYHMMTRLPDEYAEFRRIYVQEVGRLHRLAWDEDHKE